jgi:hypothetical protein
VSQRLVEVEYQGRWYPGRLELWKRGEQGWRGYVWWTEAVGMQHVGWMPAEQIRQVVGA